MDDETLTALRGSIDKWRAIVAGTVRDDGAVNCPLCRKFRHKGGGADCAGCPVSEATGQSGCEGSPYTDWIERSSGLYARTDADRALARAELDFLISLLPPGEAP